MIRRQALRILASSSLLGVLPLTVRAAGAGGRPASSIPAQGLIQPADLAAVVRDAHAAKPRLLHVGFRSLYDQAHIPGSEFAGPASDAQGLRALHELFAKLPIDTSIVVYCGCCPWSHCPNIAAAYDTLTSSGFTRVRALHIPNNFGADWVDPGYPVDKTP